MYVAFGGTVISCDNKVDIPQPQEPGWANNLRSVRSNVGPLQSVVGANRTVSSLTALFRRIRTTIFQLVPVTTSRHVAIMY